MPVTATLAHIFHLKIPLRRYCLINVGILESYIIKIKKGKKRHTLRQSSMILSNSSFMLDFIDEIAIITERQGYKKRNTLKHDLPILWQDWLPLLAVWVPHRPVSEQLRWSDSWRSIRIPHFPVKKLKRQKFLYIVMWL